MRASQFARDFIRNRRKRGRYSTRKRELTEESLRRLFERGAIIGSAEDIARRLSPRKTSRSMAPAISAYQVRQAMRKLGAQCKHRGRLTVHGEGVAWYLPNTVITEPLNDQDRAEELLRYELRNERAILRDSLWADAEKNGIGYRAFRLVGERICEAERATRGDKRRVYWRLKDGT